MACRARGPCQRISNTRTLTHNVTADALALTLTLVLTRSHALNNVDLCVCLRPPITNTQKTTTTHRQTRVVGGAGIHRAVAGWVRRSKIPSSTKNLLEVTDGCGSPLLSADVRSLDDVIAF